jgi:lysophospholipase L1-like esterase
MTNLNAAVADSTADAAHVADQPDTALADFAAEVADAYYLSDDEADRLLAGSPWKRFAVLGDSLAEGLGEASPGYRRITWADRTRMALTRQQDDMEYLNLGLRNLRSGEVREQQLGAALEFGPDLVAVVCGGNDLFTSNFDADPVEEQIEGIVAPLRESGAQVITFCLMNITKAISDLAPLEPLVGELNERIRAISRRHQALLVDMWEHPACADRNVFSSDMMHSSMRGHALLSAETIRRLGRHLAGPAENLKKT